MAVFASKKSKVGLFIFALSFFLHFLARGGFIVIYGSRCTRALNFCSFLVNFRVIFFASLYWLVSWKGWFHYHFLSRSCDSIKQKQFLCQFLCFVSVHLFPLCLHVTKGVRSSLLKILSDTGVFICSAVTLVLVDEVTVLPYSMTGFSRCNIPSRSNIYRGG